MFESRLPCLNSLHICRLFFLCDSLTQRGTRAAQLRVTRLIGAKAQRSLFRRFAPYDRVSPLPEMKFCQPFLFYRNGK